jgi:hypothetical protein
MFDTVKFISLIDDHLKDIELFLELFKGEKQVVWSESEKPLRDIRLIKKALLKMRSLAQSRVIFNGGRWEKKRDDLYLAYITEVDRVVAEFNLFSMRQLDEIIKTVFPSSLNAWHALNQWAEWIDFTGEAQWASRYKFEKQLESLRYFEAYKQKPMLNTSLPDEKVLAALYEKSCRRLSVLYARLTKKMLLSLDENEPEEKELIEEIKSYLNAVSLLLIKPLPFSKQDRVIHTYYLTKALIKASDNLDFINQYDNQRLTEANTLLTDIEHVLKYRYEYEYVVLEKEIDEKVAAKIELTDVEKQVKTIQVYCRLLGDEKTNLQTSLKKIKSEGDYNGLSATTIELRALLKALKKAMLSCDKEKIKQKKEKEKTEKTYLIDSATIFRDNLFPELETKVMAYKAFGILPKKEEKAYKDLRWEVETYFNQPLVLPMNALQFEILRKGLRHLELMQYRLESDFLAIDLDAALLSRQAAFFKTNGFNEALKDFFFQVFDNRESFRFYQRNAQKRHVLDVWIKKIEHLAPKSASKEWFERLRTAFWRLNLKCATNYSDVEFVDDITATLKKECTEAKLVALSRKKNGESLYFLRRYVFTPLYNFCYALGLFGERKNSIFSSHTEKAMRQKIYQTRQAIFNIKQGAPLQAACFIERERQTVMMIDK